MHSIFFSGPMSALVAAVFVVIWHFRRSHRRWRFRKSDYTWVFLQAGVAYVMVVFLIEHFQYNTSYAAIISRDFGGPQVTIAFFGALFESLKSLWDMWSGNGDAPPTV